ncbi:hypothetical protein JVU11DRAFT_4481 [Chiua virens]|nr:hypothetical protein JVU11DRAFT_4481 [Chiua virens]
MIDANIDRAQIMVTVKDVWIDPLRKFTEEVILHILAKYGIKGVPELIAERQVKTCHLHDETIDINCSTHFIQSQLPKLHFPADFHLQVLSCLISSPVGTLIIDFSSLGELLVAFLDCIIAHKNTVQLAQVLHCDISLVNLLLAIVTHAKKQRAHKQYLQCYLSTKTQLQLQQRIDTLSQQGILVDWGYTVPVPVPATPTPPTDDTNDPSTPHSESVPLTSPIDVDPLCIGTKEKTKSQPISELMGDPNIVLLMGTDDPEEDSRHMINSCPLSLSSRIVTRNTGNLVVDVH